MTTSTTRYGMAKIVAASDNVDVVVDFNNNWDLIDTRLGSQVCTSSTRPSSPVQGQIAYETDTGFVRKYTGTAWQTVGNANCLAASTPANPIQGDIAYVTDRDQLIHYTGSAWKYTGLVVCTSSTRPTGSIAAGTQIYETDTTRYLVYNGTSWEQKSFGSFVCTSGTHPSSPFTGLEIFETDTGRSLVYNGSTYIPQGATLMADPVSTASTGTVGVGATETFDAVMGYYQFTAVSGRRYIVIMNNLHGSGTAVADLYTLRIRNSGTSSNPTSASTLVAANAWYCPATGGGGQAGIQIGGSFVAGSSGTQTLGFSYARSAGTGNFTPVSPTGLPRELYVMDSGLT